MPEQDADPLLQLITSYECKVWDALVSGDARADEALLNGSFLGVYPDGFANKQDHSSQLNQGPTVQSYDLQNFKIMALGQDHALLSYRACFQRSDRTASEVMFVSSVWQRDGMSWTNIFSQDTPFAD